MQKENYTVSEVLLKILFFFGGGKMRNYASCLFYRYLGVVG